MSSIDELVATLTERVAAIKPFGKKIKFSLDGNIIYIDGTATPPSVSRDDVAADATITATLENFSKIMNKEINPQMAFMSGKIKVQGDMMATLALQKIM